MTPPDTSRPPKAPLRALAESRLTLRPAAADASRPAAELLHELQVHQIELEMQNEALRQTQSELEASRDRYVELYDFAPVGYLTLDADGMIETLNLAGAALLGIERGKPPRRRFAAYVVEADRERWLRHFLDLKRHRGHGGIELELRRGDGAAFHAQVDCGQRKVGAGDTAIRVTLTDISARRREERRRSDEATAHRDALVREVHHRIKNNLQSVAGLLQRELGKFKELDPRLETAISQVDAIAVVHGLQGADPNEAIRLCDSVCNICKTVSDLAQRPVRFRIEHEHSSFRPVRIESGEAVSVALVINELILNAVKHSPPGKRDPSVSLSADGSSALLVIRNALTRAPDFDIRSGAGLGTGLRLVRSLLPDQGTHLSYEIETEKFLLTTLRLTAPVAMKIVQELPAGS